MGEEELIKSALEGHGEIFEQEAFSQLNKATFGKPTELNPNGNGRQVEARYTITIAGVNCLEVFLEAKQHGSGRNIWLFTKNSTGNHETHFPVSFVREGVTEQDIKDNLFKADVARTSPAYVGLPEEIIKTVRAFEIRQKDLEGTSEQIKKRFYDQYSQSYHNDKASRNDKIIYTAGEQLASVISYQRAIIMRKTLRNPAGRIFVPLIITNARLKIWDIKNGNFSDINWLLHEHAIKNREHYITEITASGRPFQERSEPQEKNKLPVFIVNIEHVKEWFDWVRFFFNDNMGTLLR